LSFPLLFLYENRLWPAPITLLTDIIPEKEVKYNTALKESLPAPGLCFYIIAGDSGDIERRCRK
jgi:hypothetical protein